MPPAFDSLATSYDTDFSDSLIAQQLRRRVHARLDSHFQAGDHVLELGCGTGEDAIRLAERGVRVTATDASETMLAITRAKADGNPLIETAILDLQNIPNSSDYIPTARGVIANFGVLNCVGDWRPLAVWLARQIPVGGIAGFGVMSPFCLWEMGWHGLHGDLTTALRRVRGKASFEAGGEAMTIYYPTIRRLTQDFAPEFRRVHVEPLGLWLPPSDVYGAVEIRPRLLQFLMKMDEFFSQIGLFAAFADHYWIEFERVG